MQIRFWKSCASALALIGCLLVFSSSANAGEHFTRVSRATQIPDQFSTDVPLYVKGTVPPGSSPFSDAELEDLGRQIAALNRNNRQKFGVLLIENFDDETYRVENEVFRGEYKAVDAAIDIGLHNHADFAREDWAWLTICFQRSPALGNQRPITYYASNQLREWRLGVGDIWKGDLDAFMIDRLKSRHIKAAATDTIVEVNRRLDRAIQAEANRKAELQRQGIAAFKNAEAKLALLNANLLKLRTEFPNRNGNLFFPDLSSAEANLESARAAVDSENYARAKEAGDAVVSFVNEHQHFIDEYRSTPKVIENVRAQLATLAAHPFFSSASSAHATASTSADEAMKAYEFGSIEYLAHRERAVTQTSDAIGLADAAQSRHQMFVATMTFLGLLVLGIIAVILFVLRSRSQKALAAFQELLDSRRGMLDEKRVALRALQSKKVDVIGASKRESDLTSDGAAINRTEADVDEAGTLVGSVFIMLSCADNVVDQAVKMATPSTLPEKLLFGFRTRPYADARKYLSDTRVAFDKQSGLRFALDTKEVSAEEALWKDLSEFDDFKMTFVELNTAIGDTSKRANELLDGIKLAVDRIQPTLDALSETLHGKDEVTKGGYDAWYAEICATWADDGDFVLNEYPDTLVPALDKEIERLTALAKSDPITAYEQALVLGAQVEAIQAVLEQAECVATHFKGLDEASDTLGDLSVEFDWLKGAYKTILDDVDTWFASLVSSDEAAWKTCDAKEAVIALSEEARKAKNTVTSLREELEPGVAATSDLVRSARISIAANIDGLSPDSVMTEYDEGNKRDLNPDFHLKAATELANSCAQLISGGSVTAAMETLKQGKASLDLASRILKATVEAHEGYKGRVASIVQYGASLESKVPAHEEILLGIMEEFDESVLLITSEDKAAVDHNGSIEDNFDEIRTAVALRDDRLKDAEELRSEGRLLESAEFLGGAEAANTIIKSRLEGVANKRERLDRTVRTNASLYANRLTREFAALTKSIADPRVMKPTISQFDDATKVLRQAEALQKREKTDPFAIEDKLQHVDRAFKSVRERAALDLELFAKATESVKSAEQVLKRTELAAAGVLGMADNIPDSPKLRAVPGQLADLKKNLARAKELIQVESGDWDEVDDLANKVESRAETLRSEITAQSALGASAVDAINAASSSVRSAINWTGSYGVSIYGSPGNSQLNSARNALQSGDYERARQLAGQAQSAANSAIADAEAEVRRKRRAEEERRRREEERRRREEEERRRREAAARRRRQQSSSSSSSSSSFGGFSSSGGSSSFGGFSSSGGTSGW